VLFYNTGGNKEPRRFPFLKDAVWASLQLVAGLAIIAVSVEIVVSCVLPPGHGAEVVKLFGTLAGWLAVFLPIILSRWPKHPTTRP